MDSFVLRVEIGEVAGLSLGGMAATLFAPDVLPERPILVFAVPGGGYSRGYFDMRFAGHRGYSQAEHHCARGLVLIAVDHIGVGDNDIDQNGEIQFEHIGGAYDRCCRAILDKVRAGTIDPTLPAFDPAAVIGIGQSMGGCVSILTQAAHRTFDAIAVLGYSAIHTRLPQKEAAQEAANLAVMNELSRGGTGRSPRDVRMQDYVYPFHWQDVPADILEADMAGGYPLRTTCPLFGSATMPDCTVQMMIPSVVAAEAAAITVPVFAGNGERDVCPDPRAEPSAYPSSLDITTVIVPTMAHMHNFASTRARLWDRLAGWYATVATDLSQKDHP
jgi:pimeloyl-ACP methyl ester carboxylesterase